jgi:hypothetical protein
MAESSSTCYGSASCTPSDQRGVDSIKKYGPEPEPVPVDTASRRRVDRSSPGGEVRAVGARRMRRQLLLVRSCRSAGNRVPCTPLRYGPWVERRVG